MQALAAEFEFNDPPWMRSAACDAIPAAVVGGATMISVPGCEETSWITADFLSEIEQGEHVVRAAPAAAGTQRCAVGVSSPIEQQ